VLVGSSMGRLMAALSPASSTLAETSNVAGLCHHFAAAPDFTEDLMPRPSGPRSSCQIPETGLRQPSAISERPYVDTRAIARRWPVTKSVLTNPRSGYPGRLIHRPPPTGRSLGTQSRKAMHALNSSEL